MAARFIGQFYSAYTEQFYTVIVYDKSFSGTPADITITDVDINYPSSGSSRFDFILASQMNVSISVKDSATDTFIEDLAGAAEGRFMLQLLRGIESQFIGFVLPDLAEQEDTTLEVGYVFKLSATDGLGRLKGIDYNDDGNPYLGFASFETHILNCLSKLPDLLEFYGDTTPLLKTRINWHAEQYTYANTIDPIRNTRVSHRAFHERDKKGVYKYKTCFEVLEEICRIWGARLIFSNYAFWLVQINELSSTSALKVFSYSKNGTQASENFTFTKSHDQLSASSDLLRLSGGVFNFLPPLKRVRVDYKHIAQRNLVAGWGSVGTIETVKLDDFFQTSRLYFAGTFNYSADDVPAADLPLWIEFKIKFKVGDYYLKRTGSISGGLPSYSFTEWTLDSTDRYSIIVFLTQNDALETIDFSFITPNIPDDGDLDFDTEVGAAYRQNGTLYTELVFITRSLQDPWLELLFDGTLNDQSDVRRFESVNDETENSAVIDIETTIGSGIGFNSPGHLEVKDDAADWVLADGWRVGDSGGYLQFSGLLAEEIIRGQLTPIRKYQGTYNNKNDVYSPINTISRSDGVMVFGGGTFKPFLDSISGEWFFITPQTSGWTNTEFVDLDPNEKSGEGRPKAGGNAPSGCCYRIFQETGTTEKDTFFVTVNDGVIPNNEDGLLVFWNGQLIEKEYYTVIGSEIRFDFATDGNGNITILLITPY